MNITKFAHATLATLGLALAAKTASAQGTEFKVLNKCMDVPSWNVTNGTKIDLWTCNGGTNQQWIWQNDGTIRPVFNTNKCLDLPSWQTSDGTQIEIWDCNGGSNQQWSLQKDNTLQGFGGKRVEVPGFQTADGTILDYWDWNGGGNQTFSFYNSIPVRYCTSQNFLQDQDWAEVSNGPWFRVNRMNGAEVACGASCTYTNASGNYGGCPF
jgi:Ricin-type beta-trefoil lectin domain